MDGIHDLGGMQGFGEVGHSPAEPVFHHRWEAVARALLVVVAGAVKASGGEFRHSIERMEPGHYLTSSYYEHWLTAAATLAVEHGLVARSELQAGAGGRFPLSGPVLAPPVADVGPDVETPRFGAGDRVRVREWHDTVAGDAVVTAHGGVARAFMVLFGVKSPADAPLGDIAQGVVYEFMPGSVNRYG